MRCLEQIRNDVCYHNLNAKIVSVGGGLAYGSHGYTHHGVEDLAVMSAMPNMTVAAPGDSHEARAITRLACETPGPMYLRLGKAGELLLHKLPLEIALGESIQVHPGKVLTLISTGGMLARVLAAADQLQAQGKSIRVLSMPFLVPIDEKAILAALSETLAILTVEEHGYGGLGTLVAEIIARSGKSLYFVPLLLGRIPIKVAGTQDQLRARQGLSVADIVRSAERV